MPKARAAELKLLNAALSLIREKGFSATTVDDVCARAGVTKGAFFHYFATKDALGVAAAEHWSAVTGELFERAPYHDPKDPLDRVLAYIEFRRALLRGEIPEFTCVVGTMVQETYGEHPEIRDACAASIFGHAGTLTNDIADAMKSHGIAGGWTAESLATHTQAVLQGAFILAKAQNDVAVAIESVDHLKRYVELLFSNAPKNSGPTHRRTKRTRKTSPRP
ncbi:MAG: TetR/AcrR family transcriptional regulator [Acidobacteria bacterium]|nr:TetR/AcrR family transcriptional regulator [Acidobacteriota bacterium]